ncbi:hypothetical protein TVAG_468660 [Trichomonas vaginalis G3]|uniref:Glycosyltransferase 61 catalytic domain-containing protein n=1 Tax=Trichomonas vaginalis (strain ATCC PRA-98 / G3) TaxID=412133 RepID=A2F5X1_TRIV3|nr:glycosyltransferase family [Trichomonas vaginalis G3]EAX99696.1 hypothetical protein TVAG_468660 [Trichomonas vaginalis G3]KAI5494131.1 glycosyltransferase family [Trichomonas vaginalis G3]|eukprot:XP_001312626.1 hypothetical protein [Trichomonas vaginalis G3]
MSSVYFISTALNHTNATYVDFEYVYAGPYGGSANISGKLVYPSLENNLPHFGESGEVVAYYEDVISVGSKWVIMYGHWICDALAPLLFLPQEIMNKSIFLLPVNSSIYREALEVFGFSSDRILFLEHNQWVFAHHFHTVYNPETVQGCIHIGLKKLSNMMRKRFNTTNIVPTRYGFYNRPMGNRHFFNFFEFLEIAKFRFPEIRIFVLETLYPTFRESVIAYASCLMYFGPTGSNFANLVWMNPHTVCIVGFGNMHDDPVIANALIKNIWIVSFQVPGMYHHGSFTGTIDFPLAIKAINKGLFVLKNQRWPENNEIINDY